MKSRQEIIVSISYIDDHTLKNKTSQKHLIILRFSWK